MGKLAFVFAGQGSQTVGMGLDLYNNFNVAKRIFDMAGKKVKEISFTGPAEQLNLTVNTQTCLFAMDLACARALNEKGIFADGVAGFSLGEIPAVTYAEIMNDQAAYEFVSLRAKAMQECAEENKGLMFAVLKLSESDVKNICNSIGNAYPVNFNCPGQIVVACAENSAEEIQQYVAQKGGKSVKLAVSGAFHSPFMKKASDKIKEYLATKDFPTMKISVYSNVTADIYGNPKELLAKQVISPVLWQKTVENMIEDGFDIFVEVGAGKTLSDLIKKINGNVKVLNVCDMASLENTAREVQNA